MGRIAFLIFILTLGSQAFAQAQKGAKVGFAYGYSVPDAVNTKPYKLFGLTGETFLMPNWTIGGYFLFSDKSGEQSATDKFRYSLIGVQGAYQFPSDGGVTFIAGRVGITKLAVTNANEDMTMSPYHYGVALGYDYYPWSWASFGFEGSYLHVQRGKTEFAGVTYKEDSFNILSFLVTLHFRF